MTPSFPRFAGIAAAALAGVCAVGFLPTRAAAGTEGLVAMGVAAALVYAGALLGYLPLLSKYAQSGPQGLANAFLVGLGARLFFTLTGVLVLGMGLLPARASFLLFAGIGYAVILVVEIVGLVRGMPAAASASVPASVPAHVDPAITHTKGSATA